MKDKKRKSTNKGWYISLIVIGVIITFGLITLFILVKILPSEVRIQIEKAGMTITIFGGAAFFIVLFKIFFSAYTKLLTIVSMFIAIVSIYSINYFYMQLGSFPSDSNTIRIESIPDGAEVFLDDRHVGITPLSLNISNEQYLKISKNGFYDYETLISLENSNEILTVTLTAESIHIIIRSTPEGANIYLNGRLVGLTPMNLVVSPGIHDLRLKFNGFHDSDRTIIIDSYHENFYFDFKLEKLQNR